MEERLKLLRKELNKSQKEFAESLGLGQSTWAMIEVGKRELNERHIKLICSIYKINEEWLRTGEGKMYNKENNHLSRYVGEITKGNDDFIKNFIEIYMELDDNSKKVLKDVALKMADKYAKRESD
ncbi:MAG: helix-turn-helix transcriptional regulator [Clostridiales bacterium]|nr:helix-turn-helix transcriptional regulator [Clostridiales bacterium]